MGFETAVREEMLRLSGPETRWLSGGWDGGFTASTAAYNVTVPEGWSRTDLGAYGRERRTEAGFETPGPTLLTGVSVAHARVARLGPVVAVATAGISNPAALPMEPSGEVGEGETDDTAPPGTGTVNVLVATTRALSDGALGNLLTVAAEAKTATLLAHTGFPGTTTDAVVAGTVLDGERATFSGGAPGGWAGGGVGGSLDSRYVEDDPPATVEAARYGVVTDEWSDLSGP